METSGLVMIATGVLLVPLAETQPGGRIALYNLMLIQVITNRMWLDIAVFEQAFQSVKDRPGRAMDAGQH